MCVAIITGCFIIVLIEVKGTTHLTYTLQLAYVHLYVHCTCFYHNCCNLLHACVYNVHTSITTAVLPYMHACVYNVHTYLYHDCCLPYMHVCTMYILLSRLLYSTTCMYVQCTYFYHDCCTPLHACVYNVHTSITTAVLPYMHVCTMYILLSRLLYSPTCMCVQCTYFYHDCCTSLHACMCVQYTYFYHDCCTPLHACVYNVHTSITTAVLPYMHACVYNVHTSITTAVLPYMHVCTMYIRTSITTAVLPYMHVCTMYILLLLLYSPTCMHILQVSCCHGLCWWWELLW